MGACNRASNQRGFNRAHIPGPLLRVSTNPTVRRPNVRQQADTNSISGLRPPLLRSEVARVGIELLSTFRDLDHQVCTTLVAIMALDGSTIFNMSRVQLVNRLDYPDCILSGLHHHLKLMPLEM
jgi:hypothetical protein